MMKAKRLEEPKLSDTTCYDSYDMHPYDTNDSPYDHAMFPISFFWLVFSFAFCILLGLCHDSSRH